MAVEINNEGLTVIDFEQDIALASTKSDEYKGVWVAFDSDWKSEKRDFEPKALMYFHRADDIDLLIGVLNRAKKKFPKRKKHIEESDDMPSSK